MRAIKVVQLGSTISVQDQCSPRFHILSKGALDLTPKLCRWIPLISSLPPDCQKTPTKRILVLEAGADRGDDLQAKTPAFYQALLGTEVDWKFESEAQVRSAYCCG